MKEVVQWVGYHTVNVMLLVYCALLWAINKVIPLEGE